MKSNSIYTQRSGHQNQTKRKFREALKLLSQVNEVATAAGLDIGLQR